jgi:hypothetical protein
VTRLGEFSLSGQLVALSNFFNTEVVQYKKMGWAAFWATFTQTHLATQISDDLIDNNVSMEPTLVQLDGSFGRMDGNSTKRRIQPFSFFYFKAAVKKCCQMVYFLTKNIYLGKFWRAGPWNGQ